MSEVEDGMGFSGLVLTTAERKQDEYEKELWNKIRQKERRVLELEEVNSNLLEALEDLLIQLREKKHTCTCITEKAESARDKARGSQ